MPVPVAFVAGPEGGRRPPAGLALSVERKVSQRPQQHGHDGAERRHASLTSRTVASLVELATRSG
jgi:hypothetical protein